MGYPDFESELEILSAKENNYDSLSLEAVLTPDEITACQGHVKEVFVEDTVLHYLVKIVEATRTETEFRHGISPRGSVGLESCFSSPCLILWPRFRNSGGCLFDGDSSFCPSSCVEKKYFRPIGRTASRDIAASQYL